MVGKGGLPSGARMTTVVLRASAFAPLAGGGVAGRRGGTIALAPKDGRGGAPSEGGATADGEVRRSEARAAPSLWPAPVAAGAAITPPQAGQRIFLPAYSALRVKPLPHLPHLASIGTFAVPHFSHSPPPTFLGTEMGIARKTRCILAAAGSMSIAKGFFSATARAGAAFPPKAR